MLRAARIVCLLLSAAVMAGDAAAAAPPDPVARAARRGLWRLEQGAASYVTYRQCFSCHHQSLTLAAFAAAKARGLSVSLNLLREQTEFTLATFRDKHADLRKGSNVGGRNTTVAYALYTLQSVGHAADKTTDALVDFLLVGQDKDGAWPAVTQRQPSEGSKFTNAALALSALRHYGPRDGSKGDRAARIDDAFRKGAAWLTKNKPGDTEDQVFHLRALVAAGADAKAVAEARRALLGAQLPDGSWRQLPSRPGDAYATATALLALRHAGVKPDDAAFRKGVAYLVRTQTREGAWIVPTRSKPIQKWFDNGDPGGKSQFISFLATGWSTLALLESLPRQ
jgi:N-acyl-D-amino-acid deacylase